MIAAERGIPRGVTMDVIESTDSFEGVLAAARELYADANGYETLLVDTLDALEPYLQEWVCAENKWKNIESPGFGKGHAILDDAWRRFLRAMTAIRDKHGMTVVMICHAGIERIDDPRAPSYTAYAPKLHKRARALVMDACDAVLFLAEDLRVVTDDAGFHERTRASTGSGRFLFTEGRPAFAAKNRFGMPEKISAACRSANHRADQVLVITEDRQWKKERHLTMPSTSTTKTAPPHGSYFHQEDTRQRSPAPLSARRRMARAKW